MSSSVQYANDSNNALDQFIYAMTAFNSKWKYEKLAVVVRVPQTTQTLVISRFCRERLRNAVADLGKKLGGPPPPLILGKKEKKREGRKASRASKPPPPPPLAQGLDPPLKCTKIYSARTRLLLLSLNLLFGDVLVAVVAVVCLSSLK